MTDNWNRYIKVMALLLLISLSPQVQALQVNGYSEFAQRYELNASVSGYVAEVPAYRGKRVKHGDVLLVLDQSRYRLALDKARATVMLRQPAQSQMLNDLEKAQELFDRDSLALIELQQAENNLQVAQSHLDIARAELGEAELALKQTVLKAPVDGLVLRLHTHRSRYINTAVTDPSLLTLVDSQNMLAIATLSSEQWNPALVGKLAKVTYRSKSYHGKVLDLDYAGASNTTGLAVFELRVLFGANGEIPANMPVTIDIQE